VASLPAETWFSVGVDDGCVTVSVSPRPATEAVRSWDRLVERTPGTDVTQLSAWARVRAPHGFTPLYLFAHRGGELVGGAQVLIRRLPLLGAIGYVPYGPLVDQTADGCATIRRGLLEGLHRLCEGRLRMLFVQPAEGDDDVSTDLLACGFRRSSADIAPAGSIRIDLADDLGTIRSRFGRRLRSWPNRWPERGVTVNQGDARDIPLLTSLAAQTAARHGFRAAPPEHVATVYRELAPGGHAALFVGRVHGTPVAADLVTVCGGMIRGRLCGFDHDGEAARLSVPAAIRWEIIQWGQARGLRWLDFGGLSAASLHALLDGGERTDASATDQPKLTFGGTPFRYPPAVELVTPPSLRMVYDVARRSPQGRHAIMWAQQALRGRRAGGTEARS
jgi:hypothetical protein